MSKDMQVANLERLRIAPAPPAPDLPDPVLGREVTPEPVSAAAVTPAPASAVAPAPEAAPVDPDPELDELERRAWRAFLTKHAKVARILETDLVARSALPLAEFDVLFQLAQSDDHRLRMNELANRVLLSRAGITRLVDRLVADGLVARLKCESDARGFFAVLTDSGLTRLDEARPGHLAAVKRYFVESFSRPELETLAELMERSVPTD
jgi:DNA-binding MarR family transcriptional regulator